jgi:transposase-like protein
VKQDMNLVKLIEEFGSEDACRERLAELRWPDGVKCPRCKTDKITPYTKREQYDCRECDYRFSVTSGTVFADSHLPLWKWYLAAYLITESRKGISANQLKRTLSVTYKTAWYLCHRIRAAMTEVDPPKLTGTVEIDETYFGGKVKGRGRGYKGNKHVIVGAVQRGGDLRLRAVDASDGKTLRRFVRDVVDDSAEALYTDEYPAYGDMSDRNTRHERVAHRSEEWVNGDIHTNTVESAWSLFDRAVIGSYHKLSHKHLPAYLAEFEFRFNNRENPYLFRDTMMRLVQADPLTYKTLVAK